MFKKGDKVRVIDNTHRHLTPVGAIKTILKPSYENDPNACSLENDPYWWSHTQLELVYKEETICWTYNPNKKGKK